MKLNKESHLFKAFVYENIFIFNFSFTKFDSNNIKLILVLRIMKITENYVNFMFGAMQLKLIFKTS